MKVDDCIASTINQLPCSRAVDLRSSSHRQHHRQTGVWMRSNASRRTSKRFALLTWAAAVGRRLGKVCFSAGCSIAAHRVRNSMATNHDKRAHGTAERFFRPRGSKRNTVRFFHDQAG